MTKEELEEIRVRAEAATKGPWKHEGRIRRDMVSPDGQFIQYAERLVAGPVRWIVSTSALDGQLIADYDFIAHARDDIPKLLAEVERLQGELRAAAGCVAVVLRKSGLLEVGHLEDMID